MAEQREPPGLPTLSPPAPPPLSARVLLIARHLPASTRMLFLVSAIVPILLLADYWCLLATRLPVVVDVTPTRVAVFADGSSLASAFSLAPNGVQFVPASAALREYQIDGTDNTNNFTEGTADLASLLPTPAYQFEAWMRDNAAYSVWAEVTILSDGTHGNGHNVVAPMPAMPVALPQSEHIVIDASLERPEAPASIVLLSGSQRVATVTFNRNSRFLELQGAGVQPVQAYFPTQPLPFAAEVMDGMVRVAIWAWVVLAVVLALTTVLDAARQLAHRTNAGTRLSLIGVAQPVPPGVSDASTKHTVLPGIVRRFRRWGWAQRFRHMTSADRAALGVLAAAFGFVLFVALAQYHGEPHILDASAYYFQAKIFASGRLAAAVPADPAAFQGPFMVAWDGRWFAQYPPATSALLALGMMLRVPWLVEPLLGVAALGGIYLLGRRLFGGPTALLAVSLGALSPFFIYLAASYLSHTVALCFEVYFLLFVLRFVDAYRQRDIVFAGMCLGVMFCARELSAVICGVVVSSWLLAWQGRRLWQVRGVVVPAVLAGLTALGAVLALYLSYNFAQTGNPLLLPRNLFSPADRYGFGVGIGFYGRHTLAAGLVVLDQLLTSLLIDLYGWPFYLTLAFIPLALLRRDRARRWDWFALTLAALLFIAQAGYFYHGIFLGPRYLYETLPFLLLLTARGITALPVLAKHIVTRPELLAQHPASTTKNNGKPSTPNRSLGGVEWLATSIVVLALVSFNLTFYLPRQIAQHANFSGLPSNMLVDAAVIYDTHLHHALVVSGNWMVYNYILWPLNDPQLAGDMLYAYAPDPADVTRLKREYPDRSFYSLDIRGDGTVSFISLTP